MPPRSSRAEREQELEEGLAGLGMDSSMLAIASFPAPVQPTPNTGAHITVAQPSRLLRQLGFMDGSKVDIGSGPKQPRELIGDDTEANLAVAALLLSLPAPRAAEDRNNLACALLWSGLDHLKLAERLFESAERHLKPDQSMKREVVERNRRVLVALCRLKATCELETSPS